MPSVAPGGPFVAPTATSCAAALAARSRCAGRCAFSASPTGALIALGCGDDSSPVDAGSDATTDSGGSDSGPDRDAGVDAGGDAAVDAGPGADAGTDAGADAGTDAGSDAGVCPLGVVCEGGHNFAFVTSRSYVPGALGGLEGADAICNARAAAAGLPGTYVAWLSSSTQDAATRLGTASGWLRTDRRPFALSREELLDGVLRYPLVLDEHGVRVTDNGIVATATLADGTLNGTETCGDWTDTTAPRPFGGYARFGSMRWTVGFLMSCDQSAHLYCFGVDHDAEITMPAVEGRRVWLSEGSMTADGGLAGGDAICASEGGALAGEPIALMATTTASAVSRLETDGLPWIRPDGVLLWPSAADALTEQMPLAPVLMHLDGTRAGVTWTFTGATAPQMPAMSSTNCLDWTTTDAAAFTRVGLSDAASPQWFRGGPAGCDRTGHVYCFEN